jgi:hypothetical protein
MTLEQQQAIALANARLRLQESQPTEPQVTESQFAETGGGAAVGRPVRGVRLNVQPEPRPLESFMAGATRSAIDPMLAVAQGVTGGRGGVSEAVKRLAQESQAYEEANPASYIGGRVGGAVLPAAGVAKGVGMIPSFARANPYVQGAGVGAVTGAMTPVETGATGPEMYEQMGQNVATGGAIGTAIPVVGRGIQATGGAIRRGLGVTTGAGEESLAQALRAGREGNEAFLQNIKGDVSAENVLKQAKDALANMRSARSQEYQKGIQTTKENQVFLNFKPIREAFDETLSTLKSKGIGEEASKVGPDTMKKVNEIKGILNEWQKKPTLHTAGGLDDLKQRLDDVYSEGMTDQAKRILSNTRTAVKNTIVTQDKNYAKTMANYEEALGLEREIERALSLGKKSAADTAIRKLQSLTRNNANTNYGYRMELAKALQEQGGQDLMPALAGQALSSFTPRGLAGQGAALGIGAGGALTVNPMALAALPLTSPRLVGMGAYGVGKATSKIPKLSDAELRNMARILTTQGVQGAINE